MAFDAPAQRERALWQTEDGEGVVVWVAGKPQPLGVAEHVLQPHDVDSFAVPLRAQGHAQQLMRGSALLLRHGFEWKSRPSTWDIVPVEPFRVVEGEHRAPTRVHLEGGDERPDGVGHGDPRRGLRACGGGRRPRHRERAGGEARHHLSPTHRGITLRLPVRMTSMPHQPAPRSFGQDGHRNTEAPGTTAQDMRTLAAHV
jgi:hypothetical protein